MDSAAHTSRAIYIYMKFSNKKMLFLKSGQWEKKYILWTYLHMGTHIHVRTQTHAHTHRGSCRVERYWRNYIFCILYLRRTRWLGTRDCSMCIFLNFGTIKMPFIIFFFKAKVMEKKKETKRSNTNMLRSVTEMPHRTKQIPIICHLTRYVILYQLAAHKAKPILQMWRGSIRYSWDKHQNQAQVR